MERLAKNKSLYPYVKEILFIEKDDDSMTQLPFYADGFPGMVYSESEKSFTLQPRNKPLSDFYLYGQTIDPISLDVHGSFKLLIIKLYPFAVKLLLEIDPKLLNDDCFDLNQIKSVNTKKVVQKLGYAPDVSSKMDILAHYILELVKVSSSDYDARIRLATNLIINSKGTLGIKQLREQLYITERTFERQFAREIGVTPKQFAKIIQFSTSLNQITEEDYYNLTEVSYEHGFADQSHFIKTFKRYTGKTPKEYQKLISA